MGAVSRVFSGGVAVWLTIVTTFVTQLVSVPIYLSHWSSGVYGTWIAIQASTGLLTILDQGHQQYLQNEFLRLGANDRLAVRRLFWSAAPVAILIGGTQLTVVWVLVHFGCLKSLFGGDESLLAASSTIVLAYLVHWVLLGSVGGIAVRVVSPFGYYPRMTWWNVKLGFIPSVLPLLAVSAGFPMLKTGCVWVGALFLVALPQLWDIAHLFIKERLFPIAPEWRLGARTFFKSQSLVLKILVDMARSQGTRILLAPLAGAVELANFATMRTGSNVALQALGTITNPLMPELMRFLNRRDQSRSEAAFAMVWIVLIALMTPCVVVLQAVVAPLFEMWTRGKVPFDPALFALLSLGVLVYALAQPAMAVVMGNNLLRSQVLIAVIAALVVVGSMFLLVPRMGILGAGVSLLTGELVAAEGYRFATRVWLRDNGLAWPHRQAAIASLSVWIAAAAMGTIVCWPSAKWISLPIFLILLACNLWRYWRALPDIATQRAFALLAAVPGVRRLYLKRA